jgi:hypothetical protein
VCCHLLAHLLVPGELADRVQVWVGSIRDRGVLAGLTGVHGAEPVSDAARSPPFLLWKAHLSLSQDRCVVVGELACERVYSMWDKRCCNRITTLPTLHSCVVRSCE